MKKGPTLAGFQWFITNIMGVTTTELPMSAPVIEFAFNLAKQVVWNPGFRLPESIYDTMVYNLAANYLIYYAPDQAGDPAHTWSMLRNKLHLNSFVGGLVSSASDQGTADGLMIPKSLEGLTLGNLAMLKTPYGQRYLELAQSLGNVWGIN